MCAYVACLFSGIFSLGVLKYVVCLCNGCNGCCVFCLNCESWSCRCSCMGSVRASTCICCMFVSCGSPQCCVLNNLQFVNAGRRCKMDAMSVSFCLPHPVAVSTFIIFIYLCACTEML